MKCFKSVEKEEQNQFVCKFIVKYAKAKQMQEPDFNKQGEERAIRFRIEGDIQVYYFIFSLLKFK